jgi:hypothetical protein
MTFHATAAGLWLIGVGSLLAALPRLLRPPRPELGLAWESLAKRVDRLHFAAESVGLVLVAAGSVVVALAELGPWWLDLAAIAAAALAVWWVAAFKLRQLWRMRAEADTDAGPSEGASAPASEERAVAMANSCWSVCFRRAFAPTGTWPPRPASADSLEDRLQPHEITELQERGARLEDAQIPPAVRHDVVLIRSFGFKVEVVGDALVATAPDGRTAQVSRSGVSVNSAVAVLQRQRWLYELEQLGLPVHPGPRGQPQVGGGLEWRLEPVNESETRADTGHR